MATIIKGCVTLDEVWLIEVTQDPTVSPGASAPIGSTAYLNGGRGVWQKIGPLDTEWITVVTSTPGGAGVVPPFVFSKDGNITVGTYLRTGVVPGGSGGSGQLIRGVNTITDIYIRNSVNVGSVTRVQFQKRTAVSTWVDITGAYVDIPAGNYAGTNEGLTIAEGPDWEIGCYNKSGSSLNNAVVTIFMVPVGS